MSYDLSAERRAARALEDSVRKATEEMEFYETLEKQRIVSFKRENALRERIRELEEENKALKAENAKLKEQTVSNMY